MIRTIFGNIQDMKRRTGFVLLTAAALTFLAPLGTSMIPLPRRAFDWLTAGIIWEAAILFTSRTLVRRWLPANSPASSHRTPLQAAVLTLLIASIPAAPLTMLVMNVPVSPMRLAIFWFYAMGLGFILSAIRSGCGTTAAATIRPPLPPASATISPVRLLLADNFLARHAPTLTGATLLALSAEDHYLRIHTDRGQALVLLRLRDALDTLDATTGLQVHRSFWVAKAATPKASRRGQSWQLELPGGVTIPVSRTHIPACRTAGWL